MSTREEGGEILESNRDSSEETRTGEVINPQGQPVVGSGRCKSRNPHMGPSSICVSSNSWRQDTS